MFPVSIGAEIYFAERIDTLTTNLAEARPTIMTAVPRLYEVMRSGSSKACERPAGFENGCSTRPWILVARLTRASGWD